MGATFAELVLLAFVGIVFYVLLRPVQRRLEGWLYAFFSRRRPPREGRIFDITPRRPKE